MSSSPSRLIAFPFVLFLILFFTTGIIENDRLAFAFLAISIIAMVLIYVFHHQINQIIWNRIPPKLDAKTRAWLLKSSRLYNSLSAVELQRIDYRLSLFMRTKNFVAKREKEYSLEEDVKAMVSLGFVVLTRGRIKYLFENYDQIVVYDHPFASPEKQFLHALELHHEDGVIIFSREQLLLGFYQSEKFLDLSVLAASIAFVYINSDYFNSFCSENEFNIDEAFKEQYLELTGDSYLDPAIFICYQHIMSFRGHSDNGQKLRVPLLMEA